MGLPVYRVGGGAGYLWAARRDAEGQGTLRFAAADMAATTGSPNASRQVAATPLLDPGEAVAPRGADPAAAGPMPQLQAPQPATAAEPTFTLSKPLLEQPAGASEAAPAQGGTLPRTASAASAATVQARPDGGITWQARSQWG